MRFGVERFAGLRCQFLLLGLLPLLLNSVEILLDVVELALSEGRDGLKDGTLK